MWRDRYCTCRLKRTRPSRQTSQSSCRSLWPFAIPSLSLSYSHHGKSPTAIRRPSWSFDGATSVSFVFPKSVFWLRDLACSPSNASWVSCLWNNAYSKNAKTAMYASSKSGCRAMFSKITEQTSAPLKGQDIVQGGAAFVGKKNMWPLDIRFTKNGTMLTTVLIVAGYNTQEFSWIMIEYNLCADWMKWSFWPTRFILKVNIGTLNNFR